MKKTIKIGKWVEVEEEIEVVFPFYRKYISKHDLYLYEGYYFLNSENKCYEVSKEQSEGMLSYGLVVHENFEMDHEFYHSESGYLDSNEVEFLDAYTQCKNAFNI